MEGKKRGSLRQECVETFSVLEMLEMIRDRFRHRLRKSTMADAKLVDDPWRNFPSQAISTFDE